MSVPSQIFSVHKTAIDAVLDRLTIMEYWEIEADLDMPHVTDFSAGMMLGIEVSPGLVRMP